MKLLLINAAGAALLCAVSISSVAGQAIEVQHEGGFPEQALKYLSAEAEDTLKSTDETYTSVYEPMYEDEDEESFVGDDGVPSISAKTSKTKRPTPVPTKKPTPSPTKSAKSSKTKRPTPVPTKRPTPRPTKSAKSSKTKRPTPRPTKTPTPRPTKSAKSSKTKNPTPRPTKRPTPRPTKRPTPRPTKMPTVSRHQANKLIARKWKDDECAVSCRFQSTNCLDLDEGVCSMRERRIINRFSKKAVQVCNKVGLPPRTTLEGGSMSEDEDYDYDVYAATTSPKSSKRSKSGSYDYDVYAATTSSKSSKRSKSGSYDYDVYAATTSSKSSKRSKSGSYDYDVYAASISTKSSKSDTTTTSSKGSKSSNLAFD